MGQPLPPSRWALPDPRALEPGEEVVAVGGDLAPSTLLEAYRIGLFPMGIGEAGPLGWWSPDPRGVLPVHGLRISRSLTRSMRRYTVTIDEAFDEVVEGCADPLRESSWITDEFAVAYGELHRLGWAHSVEVWTAGGRLAGGLYGVEVGGLFAGESMFHWERDASKVALVALVERLRQCAGPRLIDVQWRTPHLASLGVVAISRMEYLRRLEVATAELPCFGP